ncbi:MAG: hypothetical protein ACR2NY_06340 [Alphaproteobacteria bacterium]
MPKINIDKEWGFIVREMKCLPKQFPPVVVACRELLMVMRQLLIQYEKTYHDGAYIDMKKIYQKMKKSLHKFY